ncbi:MAG: ABC-2 family transporter protein [Abitibacteriaceae bacterium]|nr:ABC-2 family transporter protein [Abditibacteriaceae bacterium]
MEFRAQFFAGIVGYLIWTGVSLLFIEAVFGQVGVVRGWSREEMWVLYGTYVALESLCYGLLGPNMFRFSNLVREGGLDLALTKPVNTQFYVSTRYIDPNGVMNGLPGIALLWYGLHRLSLHPSLMQWGLWLALLFCGLVMAYCIWFFCVTWAIWAVKLEGIAVIFDPMMQMARFPLEIYPQRLQSFLIFVLPVAFLTTYPTEALLGKSHPATLLGALALAAVMLWLTHLFFHFALRFYSSASS